MTVYQTDKLLDVFILCTRASHRGRGLAGQLVKTALENAKSEAEFPTPEVEVRSGLVLAPALLYLKQPAWARGEVSSSCWSRWGVEDLEHFLQKLVILIIIWKIL